MENGLKGIQAQDSKALEGYTLVRRNKDLYFRPILKTEQKRGILNLGLLRGINPMRPCVKLYVCVHEHIPKHVFGDRVHSFHQSRLRHLPKTKNPLF